MGTGSKSTARRTLAAWLSTPCQRDVPAEELYDALAAWVADYLAYLGVAPEQLRAEVEAPFVRLLASKAPKYTAGDGSPKTWMMARAHYRFLQGSKAYRQGHEQTPTVFDDEAPLSPERVRRWQLVQRGVEALPLDQAVVMVLYEAHGFTVEQIAKTMQLQVDLVQGRLRKARTAVVRGLPFEPFVEPPGILTLREVDPSSPFDFEVLSDELFGPDDTSPVGPPWSEDPDAPAELREAMRDWRDHPPASSLDLGELRDALFGPRPEGEPAKAPPEKPPLRIADDPDASEELRKAAAAWAEAGRRGRGADQEGRRARPAVAAAQLGRQEEDPEGSQEPPDPTSASVSKEGDPNGPALGEDAPPLSKAQLAALKSRIVAAAAEATRRDESSANPATPASFAPAPRKPGPGRRKN